MSKNIILKKETIKRLIHDVKNIIKNPLNDNGIYYHHDTDDILTGYALIIGPSDTPYFGGNYLFELKYPDNYPHSPPIVTYCTNGDNIRFNPNLYTNGKVCISLLNTWRGDQWTSCQTISTVLLTLCSLLNDTPILNEPGVTNKHNDYSNYHKIITFKNYDIAIINYIRYFISDNHCVFKFSIFKDTILDNFKKNIGIIMNYLEKHKYDELIVATTTLYNMNVIINYTELYEKMNLLIKELKIKLN